MAYIVFLCEHRQEIKFDVLERTNTKCSLWTKAALPHCHIVSKLLLNYSLLLTVILAS